ncbi:MAG: 2-hydroxyacyl-CoA dehydratase family protein [bacterium]
MGPARPAGEKVGSALEELTSLPLRLENPYIRDWKRTGKVFGFMCSYVPEELLYAEKGLILPVRVGAAGCTSTDEGDIYLHRFNCSYARCLLQLGLTGAYDFLDGFVFMNGCEQLRRVYEIWRDKVKPSFVGMISVPHTTAGEARFQWYLDDLVKLREEIATRYGLSPSGADLRAAIRHYNRFRRLMGDLYNLRAQKAPPVSGAEAMKIANAAYAMPKEAFNDKLERAVGELRQRPGISSYRARIMVCGSYMDDTFLIELIESTGALVVTDNLCFGRRHIEGLVEEDGDPLIAVARRYFFHNPCPRMLGTYQERLETTKRLAREAAVDGVIFQRIPFCDTHGAESPMLAPDLEKAGIPTLILDREYIPSDQGRLKTRIQAFLEKMGK